jgi:hypothetical protein
VKLKLDENLPATLAERKSRLGHDAVLKDEQRRIT